MARTIVAAVAALVTTLSAAPTWASPRVSVEPERVSIEELAAGGRVAVFGLMRRVYGVIPGFERWKGIVEDSDGDGRVEIALEQPAIPEWSQWVVVDLDSGEWATAGRSESEGRAQELATGEEVSSGSTLWQVPEGSVEVLVVRPGGPESAGAWGGSVWDGGSADGDGLADGRAGVMPAGLSPVEGSGPAPESYAAGDVLIAVTPRALRYGITRVGGGEEVE